MSDPSPRTPRWVVVVLVVLVGLTAGLLIALERRYRKIDRRLRDLERLVVHLAHDEGPLESIRQDLDTQQESVRDLRDRVEVARREPLEAALARRVERLVEGAEDDQQRCLRLARWVAGHVSNRRDPGGDPLRTFATRAGYCRARADLFIRMCQLLHIPARVLNLYNFSPNMSGHSCAQAWYDDGWHFFDVTYAGVFMHEGNVLSWEQICADPERAVAGMAVFDRNLDRWSGTAPAGARVVNAERMRANWSPERIQRVADAAGLLGSPSPKWLTAAVDLARHPEPLTLGQVDGRPADVTRQGRQQRLSGYLGHALGTGVDTLHTRWHLTGGRPGRTWAIRYRLCEASHAELAFWARSPNAEIVAGRTFQVDESPADGEPASWEIRLRLNEQGAATVRVGYDFRQPDRWVGVDQIQIVPIAEP